MGSDRLYQEIYRRLKMSEGKRVLIILPDERRLELLVQPNLLSSDLLDLVTSQVGLKEKEFFGLAYVDETGHYSWLQYDRRVLDHEFPKKNALPPSALQQQQQQQHQQPANNNHGNKCGLVLYFLIKFYVESISLLRDSHTVEHFYLQLRSMVFKDQLEVGPESVHVLAAWALQAAYGDYVDEATARTHLKKSPFLPASALKEAECEDRVIEAYRNLTGHSRGQVIVSYLSRIESLPNYGVHFYSVTDKRNTPWYLGISYKGIAQYDHADRRQPRRVFQWKQLENLYFRDRKFSIEVHDPKRALHATTCTESPASLHHDDDFSPSDALNSVDEESPRPTNRRTVQAGSISVIVWFGQTQALTKSIWHMAICQHQFYLDRRNSKTRQIKARNLNDIALDLSKSSTSLSLSTASSTSQSNLSHSGSTLSLNGKMGGQTPEAEESEAARAARMEIVAALKARKMAMEEKLKAKLEELKKICLEEGGLTGQLPPEYPLSPGEAPPTIRRRVGTAFTLPENLLNRAKSSKEESLAALELEYEIQRKITSAALKLSNDGSPSKAVKRQRKMIYQQSLQQLKDIEAKLRTLRLAEMYNSTQAQPQVPAVNSSSPWSKAKKKPRPLNGGSLDSAMDEEAGFIQPPDLVPSSSESHDMYLDDLGVNLSPATTAVNNHHHNHHQPITATPLRRDRSLSPTIAPVSSVTSQPAGNVARTEHLPRSAPASPHKLRHNNNPSSTSNYQHQHYANGLNHHHHHHTHGPGQHQHLQHHNHQQVRRETSAGYVPNSAVSRSSYRSKQYPTLSSGQTTPTYLIKDMPWDSHHHNAGSHRPQGVPSSALCPPLVGVDSTAGGGLYNIARQRASHDFPTHTSMDDLEVIGLRRLTGTGGTGGDHSSGSGEVSTPRGMMTSSQQHSPATTGRDSASNPNTSGDFEWDFGDEQHQSATPATRRLDHLVQQHQFSHADRRRRMMNMSMDADIVKSCAIQASRALVPDGSRSMDELDGPSHLTVDVIDGASIGPRFGGRGLRKASSTSSNQSSNFNEPELTLLPNQTYPDFPDFASTTAAVPASSQCRGTASRMETVFDVDSAVYTRQSHNVSTTSIHSVNKKKEKDWYETSLDSPVTTRKGGFKAVSGGENNVIKPIAALPSSSSTVTPVPTPSPSSASSASTAPTTVMSNGTSTVRAQPVRLAENDHEDDFEFETVVPFESPKNLEVIAPGKFEPYREISKPFETSDIYKYSAKYRQQQQQQQNNNKAQHQTKGLYHPLQPLACQPLGSNGSRGLGGQQQQHTTDSGERNHQHSNPPVVAGPEFRSKPATLV